MKRTQEIAMTTLTSNDPSSALATGAASLRIVQPGVAERLMPLPTGKCTVGSSDRCQVHLTDAQVRPLHCLIVHESSETLVTRWAPGVLLNGQEFATSAFEAGDCLQIGDVQLFFVAEEMSEVVTETKEPQDLPEVTPVAATFATASNAFAMPAPVSVPQAAAVSDASVTSSLESDRLVGRLKTANEGARQRCRKLVGSLRTMRTEASSFDQRIDELQQELSVAIVEREQIFSQLSQLQTETGEQNSQSSEEVDRLISELTAAYEKSSAAETALAEHVEQAGQLKMELASLQGQREQWEQVRTAGELQRSKLAEALADRERSIETLQAEIDQAREASSHVEANRTEQTAALESLQAELEGLRSEREHLVAAQAESNQRAQDAEQRQADSEQNLSVFQLELEKFQITSRQAEQELFESKSALENLQAEFNPLAAERDELVSKRTESQLREQGWEHELASRDSQIENLAGEIEQLRTTIAEVNQEAASQVAQVGNFEQQLGALTTERDQLLAAQGEQVEKTQEWEETVAFARPPH